MVADAKGPVRSAARVLVTGATGLVGARLVPLLAERGFHVVALARRARADLPGAASFLEADLLEPSQRERAVARAEPELCVHLAWITEPGVYLESPENARWAEATIALGAALARAGTKRLVAAGTCAEHAPAEAPLSEASAVGAITAYGREKSRAFDGLLSIARSTPLSLAWGRLFHLYGPGEDRRRLVPSILSRLARAEPAPLTHGASFIDLMHADDVARAFAFVLESDLEGAVQIASGTARRVRDVALEIGHATGRPDLVRVGALPSPPIDLGSRIADVARLRSIGFSPSIELRDGLARYAASLAEERA